MSEITIWNKAGRLFFLLLLTFTVGYVGSGFMTPSSMIWYHDLMKSSLTPPDSWFGMAWVLLYFCMSLSAWIVWGKVTPRPFVLQLACNLIWPFLFFYLQTPVWAFLDIVLMIVFIFCCMYQFGKFSFVSAGLMIPVLIWSFFALYLNGYVAVMNTPIVGYLGLI